MKKILATLCLAMLYTTANAATVTYYIEGDLGSATSISGANSDEFSMNSAHFVWSVTVDTAIPPSWTDFQQGAYISWYRTAKLNLHS
jgi:hypothetical protein